MMKMKMNEKVAKNMRGLMCHTPAATAVCMASEPLSVIVQRRRPDHARLINSAATASGFPLRPRRSSSSSATVPSLRLKNGGQEKAISLSLSQSQVVSSFASKDQVFQVVVMRVSLHCQGCAGKVKKHLSKMEGVTSFSIDLESKRVTVMGHVSPVVLVESMSKVKRAELWPSSSSSAAC